ncbi:hypothetical protein Y09_0735 [Brachybacterium sp. SW0106-09]|nr:hypothetical protein Y09_0735 [Brachybacterium sp. SW0106-09]
MTAAPGRSRQARHCTQAPGGPVPRCPGAPRGPRPGARGPGAPVPRCPGGSVVRSWRRAYHYAYIGVVVRPAPIPVTSAPALTGPLAPRSPPSARSPTAPHYRSTTSVEARRRRSEP